MPITHCPLIQEEAPSLRLGKEDHVHRTYDKLLREGRLIAITLPQDGDTILEALHFTSGPDEIERKPEKLVA